MKYCERCNIEYSDESTTYCVECGRVLPNENDENGSSISLAKDTNQTKELEYINYTQKKKNNRLLIVLSVVIVILIGLLFAKDTILYDRNIKKAQNAVTVEDALKYYKDALDVKYNEGIIHIIQARIESSDDFEQHLKYLEDTLKKASFDTMSASVYAKKSIEAYENGEKELSLDYMIKAEKYNYDISKLSFYKEFFSDEVVVVPNDTSNNEILEEEIIEDYEVYSDYIISDSNVRYLNYSDLARYSSEELGYIRNEIFARHGYMFESPKYQNYFGSKSWYTPNPNFSLQNNSMNDVEISNISFIKSFE